MTSPAAQETPLSNRRVLNIAVPIVLSNATVPILGAVDTGVVGQIGLAAPIGAVGIGAIILTAIYWIFGFLRMGTAGLAAQAYGRGDTAEVSALLMRALIIGGSAGIVMVLFQIPLFKAAFHLAPASAEVENLAHDYLGIRVWSAPAAIAIFGVTGWLIALERTKAVFLLQFWMNGVNILLDLLFVLQFDWGVNGVALATFIAEWSGLFLALYLARDAFKNSHWKDRARIFDRERLRMMASVNGDIMIRTVLLEAAFVSFLFLGSGLDDVTLAANQVLVQFLHITAHALDGFAFAAEALVGQAFGARNKARVKRSVWLTSLWGLYTVILLAIAFWFIGPWLISVMAKSVPVQDAAESYIGWMVAAPLLGVAAWMFDGIFIGATRTRDMRNMMFLSFLIYLLALALLFAPFGNHGLWAALLIMFVARGITLGLRYPALLKAAEETS